MLGESKRSILKFTACLGLVLGIVFAAPFIANPSSVFAAPPVTQTTDNSTTDQAATTSTTDDKTTACAVEKIGWFICPVIEQAGKISDKAFEVLANNFLRVEPELASDKSGTRDAWEYARNLANVMFIISFLVIILSQVTNRGISNYGIKKMLPRLIIAAIAVNVSYYICQAAVDITNILGYEIQNTMAQISNQLGPSVFGSVSQYGVDAKSNGAWGNMMEYLVVGALATAGVVWLLMGPMLAVIMMALITVTTIVVILLLRKALIVLLIVVSPIAFVMYLLPNTEKFFSKWMKMFGQLLMVFPVVAMLFGAGQLASTIILVAGSQSGAQADAALQCNPDIKEQKDQYKANQQQNNPNDGNICGSPSVTVHGTKDGKEGDCNGDRGAGCQKTVGIMMGLIAMGIAVAPLIAVWSVLKGALAAAGSIGGKVSATITKGGGNLAKRAESADQARQNRMALRAMQGRPTVGGGLYRRRAKRDAIKAGVERELKNEQSSYIAGELTGANPDTSLERKIAGGSRLRRADEEALGRVQAAALSQVRSEQNEAMKAAHATVDDMDITEILHLNAAGQLDGGALHGADVNDARTAAMIQRAFEAGDGKQKAAIIDAFSRAQGTLAARTTGESMAASNPGFFGAADVDKVRRGVATMSANDMAIDGVSKNRFGAEKMVSASGTDADWIRDIVRDASVAGNANAIAGRALLGTAAREVVANDQLRGKLRNNAPAVNDMTTW